MKVGFLLHADAAEAINGKLYALGAGWNQLRFPELPVDFGFLISLGLDVDWNETNQRHALRIHVEGPDGDLLGDQFTLELEAGRPPGSAPGQDQRVVLALGLQCTFEVEGPHATVVSVAEDEIGRSRFYVSRSPAIGV